jgi:hypothetical protein
MREFISKLTLALVKVASPSNLPYPWWLRPIVWLENHADMAEAPGLLKRNISNECVLRGPKVNLPALNSIDTNVLCRTLGEVRT